MNHKKKGMVRQMKRQSMRNKMMAWIMVFAMVVSSINVMTFKQRVNAEETEVTEETGEEGTTESGENPDNMVTVELDANGGTLSEGSKNITVTVGEKYPELPTPIRKGYTFAGWYLGEGETAVKIDANTTVEPTEEHTLALKAKWTGNEIIVTLEADGGELPVGTENNIKVTVGGTYGELPKPTKTGHTFAGWYLGEGETAVKIDANTAVKPTEEHTLALKAHWESFEIKCQDIVYGDTFDLETKGQNSGELVWHYKEEKKGDGYVEFNPKEFKPNAGTYSIYAMIKGTKDQSNSITVMVNKAVPKYNLPQSKNIRAYCGEKLSDVSLAVQNDNGHFEWKNPDKILKEGSNKEYIKFIPNDTKNYTESKDILVQFEVIHDFTAKNCFEYEAETEPVVPKTNKKGKEVEAGKVGHRESYKCKGCGKQFDAKTKQEHDASWFVKPCCVKELTVELGKTYSLKDFVKVGQEYVDKKSTTFKNQKYLKWDKNKETLKAVKYYKDILKKTQTITFKDKAGYEYDVKLKVTIAAPKVVKANKKFTKKTQGIQIKRKSIKISGRNYYKYTIKYNVKDAKSLKITASGFKGKNTQKTLNKLLAKRIKKAKGTYSFGVVKTAVKKKKITFKIVADYGHKNKSESVLITE